MKGNAARKRRCCFASHSQAGGFRFAHLLDAMRPHVSRIDPVDDRDVARVVVTTGRDTFSGTVSLDREGRYLRLLIRLGPLAEETEGRFLALNGSWRLAFVLIDREDRTAWLQADTNYDAGDSSAAQALARSAAVALRDPVLRSCLPNPAARLQTIAIQDRGAA